MSEVQARSRLRVTAERWVHRGHLPADVCFDSEHRLRRRSRKMSRVGIGGPHVHFTNDRTMAGPFDFIAPGDWIVRNEAGAIIGVMTDRAFRRAYEVTT